MSEKEYDKAVSAELLEAITEIQALPAFANFALAGGTNLAIRYNHRRSIDIDLFSNYVIGLAGLDKMKQGLEGHFGEALLFCEILDPDNGEQFCFLRALISKGQTKIKVEAIQNIQILDTIEDHHGVQMLSVKDIALLKLMSACNRKAKKDIYDLDLLSNEINLENLIDLLRFKQEKYGSNEFDCLFDLDDRQNPVEDLGLLLGFDDNKYSEIPNRPNHSNDNIDIMPHSKSWISARISWKVKVKELMRKRGIIPPAAKPIN
ncbi:nucleotidyl transferase AbiEii/AbiGii toxin family protein [Chitinophaga sp. 22620]|uniref:nucleotidyl transferase AbiEii/AbiGii toxin family protein n=1 Tax=Chitinophaga sp. 22620 TaxID=3453952 RepID=UPI003F86D22C